MLHIFHFVLSLHLCVAARVCHFCPLKEIFSTHTPFFVFHFFFIFWKKEASFECIFVNIFISVFLSLHCTRDIFGLAFCSFHVILKRKERERIYLVLCHLLYVVFVVFFIVKFYIFWLISFEPHFILCFDVKISKTSIPDIFISFFHQFVW